ncbi:hypothetical protein [Niallia taxi]|uniref:Uncharacterized protein n=1 Tax=Niallia taxi TaxID=2499688 RepID=A0A3S2UWH4_9BACI|nr:hypothetical protein [Niallia taxi]RVT62570.1 hypothetical protein EM808_12350 [Niallia taxi]
MVGIVDVAKKEIVSTKTILVVVPDFTNPFFSKVFRGIEAVAVTNGYQVILGDTGNDLEREKWFLNLLHQKSRWNGFINCRSGCSNH